jgi:hypothetical protein
VRRHGARYVAFNERLGGPPFGGLTELLRSTPSPRVADNSNNSATYLKLGRCFRCFRCFRSLNSPNCQLKKNRSLPDSALVVQPLPPHSLSKSFIGDVAPFITFLFLAGGNDHFPGFFWVHLVIHVEMLLEDFLLYNSRIFFKRGFECL